MHLPAGTAIATSSSAFLFPGSAAVRATLGLVGEAFTSEELLFIGAKGKGSSTVNTLQFLVGETH